MITTVILSNSYRSKFPRGWTFWPWDENVILLATYGPPNLSDKFVLRTLTNESNTCKLIKWSRMVKTSVGHTTLLKKAEMNRHKWFSLMILIPLFLKFNPSVPIGICYCQTYATKNNTYKFGKSIWAAVKHLKHIYVVNTTQSRSSAQKVRIIAWLSAFKVSLRRLTNWIRRRREWIRSSYTCSEKKNIPQFNTTHFNLK